MHPHAILPSHVLAHLFVRHEAVLSLHYKQLELVCFIFLAYTCEQSNGGLCMAYARRRGGRAPREQTTQLRHGSSLLGPGIGWLTEEFGAVLDNNSHKPPSKEPCPSAGDAVSVPVLGAWHASLGARAEPPQSQSEGADEDSIGTL